MWKKWRCGYGWKAWQMNQVKIRGGVPHPFLPIKKWGLCAHPSFPKPSNTLKFNYQILERTSEIFSACTTWEVCKGLYGKQILRQDNTPRNNSSYFKADKPLLSSWNSYMIFPVRPTKLFFFLERYDLPTGLQSSVCPPLQNYVTSISHLPLANSKNNRT